MYNRDHGKDCFNEKLRHELLLIWALLSFRRKLIVKDNMCQQNHEDVVMIKDHDIDYLD